MHGSPGGGADSQRDERWMREALDEAREAGKVFEVPVGALLVSADETVIARAGNRRETTKDPTAHAEIVAIREAGTSLGSWRLEGATLYVTLEPCAMCAGALVNARIRRVVYGCADPKGGAIDSLYRIGRDGRLNHTFEVTPSVLSMECASLLKGFFAARRRQT